MKKDDQWQNVKSLGVVISMGFTMALTVVIGWFIGSKLDKLLHTTPWLSVIMVFIGFAAGLRSIYSLLFNKNEDK